jgi:prenyltransferase beta subunit
VTLYRRQCMKRFFATVVVVFLSVAAQAQNRDVTEHVETLQFILKHRDKESGAFKVTADGKPSVRACNGAVKALKYLPVMVEHIDKVKMSAFVLSCYDPQTGGIADAPAGKPDVGTTSVGVMVAVELGTPKEKFAKAMDYLKVNAKSFEDVRIAAAAVEAWGVKDCPFDLTPWFEVADEFGKMKARDPKDGGARDAGSLAAFRLRLGKELPDRKSVAEVFKAGQRDDGGWGKAGAAGSDQESTYRVMRACMLMKELPADAGKLRAFIAKCRNADGGSGTKPGEASSMSGVYYAAMVGKWLEALEKK